jgi:hypothetical protein
MKTNFSKTITIGAAVIATALTGSALENSFAQSQTPTDVSAPAALPSDVQPGSPLAQVIQLAQSGVDESVILSYVNGSSSPFNLTSDQIIYLKDIGLPNSVVNAMIQRDQQLGAAATATPAPAQTETPAPQPTEVTQNYFYDTLSPYGGWVNVDGYGLCWRPTVVVYDSTWQPYCDHGHWVYTDSGWYWLSDYSWGATTFHYGRWFHDPRAGWCWWPDTEWAPSWVTWRYSDDYCGWAPLPPHAVYREGVGIFYNGVAVSAGFDFGLSVNFFTFVPTRDFCDPHPRRFRATPTEVTKIYNRTSIINNYNFNSHDRTFVNYGIPPQRITSVTHTEIRPVTIRESSAPVTHGEQPGRDGSTLIVNRPHFNANPASALNNGIRPHPAAVSGNNYNPPTHTEVPRQNNFSQQNRDWNTSPTPAVNPQQTPRFTPNTSAEHPNISTPPQTHAANNYSQPSPAQNPSYDPDKHIYSPRIQQQIEQQPPRLTPHTGSDRQVESPPAAPVEHPQNNEPRQNYQPPAQNYSAPPAQNNNGSSGSQRYNGKQNQNGFGN